MVKSASDPVRRRGHCKGLLFQTQGFTLLELIASLVLLGVLTAIFGMGLVAAMKSNEFSRTNVQLSQKGQLAMARINRELMELTDVIAASEAESSQDPFIIYERMAAGNNQGAVRFCLHLDSTGRTLWLYSDLPVTVNQLTQLSGHQGDILVDGVHSLALSYHMGGSGTWSVGAKLELLSTIHVALRLNRPEASHRTQDFNTTVHLRNTNNFGGATATATPASREDYSCFISTALGI